ncbi:MAG: hypothetical protein DSY85_06460 [Marinomonas sp.]|nr:MAG: hypothetical protein DSY85_06460 [Marinomonas sp.]
MFTEKITVGVNGQVGALCCIKPFRCSFKISLKAAQHSDTRPVQQLISLHYIIAMAFLYVVDESTVSKNEFGGGIAVEELVANCVYGVWDNMQLRFSHPQLDQSAACN